MNTIYDKHALITLIKNSMGSITQKEFAHQVGLSESYFCRLMKGAYDTPPTLSTLYKLSAFIPLEDLLTVCGKATDNIIPAPTLQDEHRIFSATLLSALQALPDEWVSLKETTLPFGLSIRLLRKPTAHWHFIFLHVDAPEKLRSILAPCYYQLLFLEIPDTDQVSFVTDQDAVFEALTANRPRNLSINISALLIKPVSLQVKKEAILSKGILFLEP